MAAKHILVAAPRRARYDVTNPQSPIVFFDRDRRHPENPAYSMPAGEVCIDQGHGVKGDPAGKDKPWKLYANPRVVAALRSGVLVEVEPQEDTSDLGLTEGDLGSLLSLQPPQAAALRAAGFESIDDLVGELEKGGSKLEVLTKVKGIGKATAVAILEELQSRDLIRASE